MYMDMGKLFTCILCFLFFVLDNFRPSHGLLDKTDTINIIVEDVTNTPRRGSSALFPDSLIANFGIRNKPLTVYLQRSDILHVRPYVFVFSAGNIIKENLDNTKNPYKLYSDEKTGANFIVRRREDGRPGFTIEGDLHLDGQHLFVEPKYEHRRKRSASKRRWRANFRNKYRMYRLRHPGNFYGDALPIPSKRRPTAFQSSRGPHRAIVSETSSSRSQSTPSGIERRRNSIRTIHRLLPPASRNLDSRVTGDASIERTQQLFVEYLVVTDYADYLAWYGIANKKHQNDPDGSTKLRMLEFYSYLVNGINVRYQSIKDPGVLVTIILAGLMVSNTTASSAWTENHKIPNGNGSVNARDVLYNFSVYRADNIGILPPHDHAALFTGYTLADVTGSPTTLGISYMGSACGDWSASVIEQSYDASVVHIAAHELGHRARDEVENILGCKQNAVSPVSTCNVSVDVIRGGYRKRAVNTEANKIFCSCLGPDHDGVARGANCPSSDFNLMSATLPGQIDETKLNNPWEFSACSIESLKIFFVELDRKGQNCLLNQPSTSFAFHRMANRKPGLYMTADEQCSLSLQIESAVCRETYVGEWETLCYRMRCRPDGDTECQAIAPFDGTPCGKHKRCQNGRCLNSLDLWNMTDTCPLGDDPLTDCSIVDCHNTTGRLRCCQTCSSFSTIIVNSVSSNVRPISILEPNPGTPNKTMNTSITVTPTSKVQPKSSIPHTHSAALNNGKETMNRSNTEPSKTETSLIGVDGSQKLQDKTIFNSSMSTRGLNLSVQAFPMISTPTILNSKSQKRQSVTFLPRNNFWQRYNRLGWRPRNFVWSWKPRWRRTSFFGK